MKLVGLLGSAAAAAILALGVGTASAATGPALTVDSSAARHAISPDVYGMNSADPALADQLELPVDRWGGNLFETYNFTLGSANHANDYFFENIADCTNFDYSCSSGNVPFYRTFVSRDVARSTAPLMELPMAGYVAKDAPTIHPFTCGFPTTSEVGAQTSYDPYDANCGSGVYASDQSDMTSSPSTDGVAITAADQKNWVTDLAARGAHLFELGNEPALWSDTHRDIHPNPTTYDELWAKSKTLSEAVKDNDPKGQVIGFSEWGWPNYFCSAADVAGGGYCGDGHNTDRAAHGNTPLVNWLLDQFKAQSAVDNRRLLDYIDVHYYPQGRDSSNPMNVTRSLWDPAYTDPSYIDTAIKLIPRMHEWVADDYPGTKTALTEYDLTDPSLTARQNAIIEADSLGIFGREGLDLATYFDQGHAGGGTDGPGPGVDTTIANAFRMFRDYDGNHGQFGDTSISAASADQSKVAVYGAQRSDGALTILVLNKTAGALASPLSVAGVAAGSTVQTYQWTGAAITRGADAAAVPATASYPAQSMTLYVVIPPAPVATPTPAPVPTAAPGGSTATPISSPGDPVGVPTPTVVPLPGRPAVVLSNGKLTLTKRSLTPKKAGTCPKTAKLTVTATGKLGAHATIKVAKASATSCTVSTTLKLKGKLAKAKKVKVTITGKGLKTASQSVTAADA